VNYNNITFNYTPSTTSNLTNCTFYTDKEGTFTNWSFDPTPDNNVSNYVNSSFGSDGTYLWNVYCVDTDGNAEWAPDNKTFIIDTVDPTVNLEKPADGNDTADSIITFYYNVNDSNVTSLAEAKNFLYLINPGLFPDRRAFLNAIRETDYDIIFVDLFIDDVTLTASEVASLKIKANGGSRLIIAYMSIGEAEDYRYYWQREWETTPPSWLTEENPQWPGNYKVRYWNTAWQDIIYGNRNSYLEKVINAGFDGVYLDVIDAFEYFEDR